MQDRKPNYTYFHKLDLLKLASFSAMYFSVNMVVNNISVVGFLLKAVQNEWELIMVYSIMIQRSITYKWTNQLSTIKLKILYIRLCVYVCVCVVLAT